MALGSHGRWGAISVERVQSQVDEVGRLLAERLGARGRTLDAQIRKAGRLLPRARIRDARFLAQAAQLAQNPKLARMVDPRQADAAHAALVAYLATVDPAERRKDRLLALLGVLAFNLLLIGAGIVTWLWWQGHV